MNNNCILTIAIPTYNRARYLDLCLSQIFKQFSVNENNVEVLISDNNSADNTKDIIGKYIEKGFNLQWFKNETNVGPDRNIVQCFQKSKGKYVLIFGDDDILLDGSLDKIIEILKNGEYGIVFLKPYGFNEDFNSEKPKQTKRQSRVVVYDDITMFMTEVNYWVTYISGCIVNKESIENISDLDRFLNTNLVQLSWVLDALIKSRKNIVVNEYLVAMKTGNSGGYKLFKVFATNMNKIMRAFIEKGLPEKIVININRKLLSTFFPVFIVELRAHRGTFEMDDPFAQLRPIYKKYFFFWFFVAPLIKLPLILARIWLFFIRVINKSEKIIRG